MASSPALFTASRSQTLTYLLAVCPFSIAFLVYINSSISFVVTDLIGLRHGEGDAVGTLGFADELLALVACPLWGVLSDRIGVRHVCTAGYAIVALALVVFVQATNIYPQLLLGRLLFSIGGSAVSTMVTAVLPTVTRTTFNAQAYRASVSSELTITPERARNGHSIHLGDSNASPSARLSGFVGMCAGCGALVALVVFLPLAARFERMGLSPSQAIQRSYYLVAAVSLVISVVCFIGLRDLPGEDGKSWGVLWKRYDDEDDEDDDDLSIHGPKLPYWKQLTTALTLGFQNRSIGLGYVGGFVARASSVGISLFIPLAVNHYYRTSGLCDEEHEPVPGSGLGEIKKACPRAYIVASILTGVSQLVALIAAPAFGYLTDKSRRYNFPLLFAALMGIIGYILFAMLPNPLFERPDGNSAVFVVMALLGISQIGAIVCSLAVLSNGILRVSIDNETLRKLYEERRGRGDENDAEPDEAQSLLAGSVNRRLEHLSHLKGSIAGVYSLYGGAGILLLTKVGGLLFDILSSGTPFYIMAGFNGMLLVIGIVCGGINHFGPSAGRAR
ncbi:Major facilitator superfamily domain general substrate transporter [Penicillium coprophilum]|uniref:Major facilitator superfamily domain general substrate transporter n=1 Tax=Penicillium coprophilum TaxID=36646 RepID=UPI002383A6EB|nr:Major facilitator superfamily domain general substrate transporter [Penicillium coprophilum]KAJ5153999.1 Major facilitator superfamily domain general substrate transporter [Penicillium coprophilum]